MKTLAYLIIIFLAPLLILLNFRLLVFNHKFYQSEFTKFEVYRQFSSAQIADGESKKLINYLCCGGKIDADFYSERKNHGIYTADEANFERRSESRGLQSVGFYSQREVTHLADVKVLIHKVNQELYLILFFLVACLLLLIAKRRYQELIFGLKVGSIATLTSILILWLGSLFNFDFFFLNFHYLAFKNDFWQLPEGANLIKLFPQGFFADFANRIALQTIIMSIAIWILSYVINNYAAKKH